MKRTINLLRDISMVAILCAMFSTISSCQNNGDIGRLFGSWYISYYSVNGQEITEVDVNGESVSLENVTFSFQSGVVNVVTIYDQYTSNISQFGRWSESGDMFTLDFCNHDDVHGENPLMYSAPSWIGMISYEPMVMKVSDSKNNSFTLTWTDPEGNVRVYRLRKTW